MFLWLYSVEYVECQLIPGNFWPLSTGLAVLQASVISRLYQRSPGSLKWVPAGFSLPQPPIALPPLVSHGLPVLPPYNPLLPWESPPLPQGSHLRSRCVWPQVNRWANCWTLSGLKKCLRGRNLLYNQTCMQLLQHPAGWDISSSLCSPRASVPRGVPAGHKSALHTRFQPSQ